MASMPNTAQMLLEKKRCVGCGKTGKAKTRPKGKASWSTKTGPARAWKDPYGPLKPETAATGGNDGTGRPGKRCDGHRPTTEPRVRQSDPKSAPPTAAEAGTAKAREERQEQKQAQAQSDAREREINEHHSPLQGPDHRDQIVAQTSQHDFFPGRAREGAHRSGCLRLPEP